MSEGWKSNRLAWGPRLGVCNHAPWRLQYVSERVPVRDKLAKQGR